MSRISAATFLANRTTSRSSAAATSGDSLSAENSQSGGTEHGSTELPLGGPELPQSAQIPEFHLDSAALNRTQRERVVDKVRAGAHYDVVVIGAGVTGCLLYTSPSPRD